jgi:putative phosphoribosyl transferase
MTRFRSRQEAGEKLAAALEGYAGRQPIVLALPRGGVAVGYEVARALDAPLDVWVVRKVGVPWQPELGMGAVAEGGFVHLSPDIVEQAGLLEERLSEAVEEKRREVEERARKFRGNRPRPDLRGRTVILVDDGIATGGTVRAAIRSIRAEGPRELVLAVPVAAASTMAALAGEVDHTVCLLAPEDLYAIGLWYEDFRQVSDEEVARLLESARREPRESEYVAP